ncbi:calcium-transporting atpase [Moniliophthora roreri MCA 2997]|uniref:Calcium-transporting ATPase 1 n=2 Tax=Moniliophthora roreri TaxID=221103 RepID=V2WVF6_MONRO|nr:calcium-transporting atpase [Moniliophthora roreri MCA 2997]KAI3616014.1 calcium-transporting atpase [Moniliophthora roreri]
MNGHPRTTSLGVGQSYERKRVPSYQQPSSIPRHLNQASLPAYFPNTPRSASPPASAYFHHDYDHDDLRPTPDADSHFAYSTTLRRHHTESSELTAEVLANEAQSLWARLLAFIAGKPQENGVDDREREGERLPLQQRQLEHTPSAKFAHTSVEDTIAFLRTHPTEGLAESVISALLQSHGYNEFSVATPEPVLLKFAKTIYESPLILLLCGSATISAIMGNVDDAVSITVAVLIVLTVGFVQERRSEKSLEALNKLVPHHCHVIRSGNTHHILANELVPGDLVTFSTGDRIPADIRLISSADLEIDESSLTGETDARRKSPDTLPPTATSTPIDLADRHNIAYMGTLVRNGRASGVVIATGTQTEFGSIFAMMNEVEEKRTPLQLSMDELAQKLSFLSFGIIGVICLIGVIQSRSWLDMFTIGVSLAVAAIPEGLPIVTTVTLALGVLRMAKRKAIVKKLHSVESLGSVSVICSDKTGTLTRNEQTVTEGYTVDEFVSLDFYSSTTPPTVPPALRKTIEIGAICNNAVIMRNPGEDRRVVGQGTDVALINLVEALNDGSGFDLRDHFNRTGERPFSSETKSMAVSGFHTSGEETAGREMYYTKGSIESILERCKFYYVNDGSTPGLDSGMREVILGRARGAAARGLRVLGMAYGYGSLSTGTSSLAVSATNSRAGTPQPQSSQQDRDNLVFTGFLAMYDPPRKGVPDSIGLLQSGGVQVVMITGDAEPTALSIARKLGLRVGSSGFQHHPRHDSVDSIGNGIGDARAYCLTGKEIDQMTKAQLRERVGSVTVFARTTPRHKMRIVEAYQSRGEVVAMTGDGVNDAPALKTADIGVSMGKSGTDVAKEAADVILVDDNFSTILFAVEEGKSIFYNIQNFLSFQLSTAAAALTLITLSTMLGLSNPLNAMQILFINILMDGPPSQSLGVDPPDPSVMKRPPRRKDAPIITQRLLYRVLFSASCIVLGTLFVYVFALSDDRMSKREQTMTFSCFVFLDLVSAIQNRGINVGITQNRMLVTTVSISFITQLCLIYVPIMQSVFQTAALNAKDLGVLMMLAAISFGLHEMRRGWERRRMAEGGMGSINGRVGRRGSRWFGGEEEEESWAGRVQERV